MRPTTTHTLNGQPRAAGPLAHFGPILGTAVATDDVFSFVGGTVGPPVLGPIVDRSAVAIMLILLPFSLGTARAWPAIALPAPDARTPSR